MNKGAVKTPSNQTLGQIERMKSISPTNADGLDLERE
jgi:hypothetical protein